MSTWKVVQSKKNKFKRTKLALFVLAVVVALILLAQIIRLSQTFSSPWKSDTKPERRFTWDGQFNINLLIIGKSISLVSYNPKEEKITVINIPGETYMEVPLGFGKWQLRSIYSLGGYKLLTLSLMDFFGLPIDGFVETNQLQDLLQKNPISALSLLPGLKTDLTLWELMRLKMSLVSVRFDKIKILNLESLNVMDQVSLLDNSQVLVADSARLDSILSDYKEPNFVSEGKTIAIFNATDHPQLAQKATRLISNLGGRVIIVSNAKTLLKKTVVTGEKSLTLKRLRQILTTSDTIESKNGELESSRAQINLFLGEDYFR